MAEDSANRAREHDGGDETHAATAVGAHEHIDVEAAAHELGPGTIILSGLGMCARRRLRHRLRFYTNLVSRLFLPFFESVDGLTTASVDDYARHRLRLVRRDTVVRELTALRSFVRSDGHPVRALFTVMWETSLRIGTLRRLKVAEHYTKGAEKQKTRQVLVITW